MRGRPIKRTLRDQLLLEQEILSDDGSHAAGSAELRGCDGQVKQGEQEILHARDSVGQNSGATQWCPRPRFSDRIRNSRPTRTSNCCAATTTSFDPMGR